MTVPLQQRSANSWLYPQALSGVHRADRLWDPDFALGQEADIWEKVRRDPVILHGMTSRFHKIAGGGWHVEPAGKGEKERRLAAIFEDIIDRVGGISEALLELACAVVKSMSVSFIQNDGRKMLSLADGPKLPWLLPVRLRDVDKRRFQKHVTTDMVKDQPVIKPQWKFWSVARGKWEDWTNRDFFVKHVYWDSEDRLGYGRGLLEAIYFWHYAKTQLFEFGLQGLERWASGLLGFEFDPAKRGKPGEDNETMQDRILDRLKEFKSRHVAAWMVGEKMSLLEGGTGQGSLIIEWKRDLDQDIMCLLAGQFLGTGAGPSDQGTSARAGQEAEEANYIIGHDQKSLGETITRDLFAWIWKHNYPNFMALGLADAKMPKFILRSKTREDPGTAAQEAIALSQAGLDLKLEDVYERTGWPQPGPGDAIFKAAAPAGMPGMPPGDSGGAPGSQKPGQEFVPPNAELDDDKPDVPGAKPPGGFEAGQFGQWDESKHSRKHGEFSPKGSSNGNGSGGNGHAVNPSRGPVHGPSAISAQGRVSTPPVMTSHGRAEDAASDPVGDIQANHAGAVEKLRHAIWGKYGMYKRGTDSHPADTDHSPEGAELSHNSRRVAWGGEEAHLTHGPEHVPVIEQRVADVKDRHLTGAQIQNAPADVRDEVAKVLAGVKPVAGFDASHLFRGPHAKEMQALVSYAMSKGMIALHRSTKAAKAVGGSEMYVGKKGDVDQAHEHLDGLAKKSDDPDLHKKLSDSIAQDPRKIAKLLANVIGVQHSVKGVNAYSAGQVDPYAGYFRGSFVEQQHPRKRDGEFTRKGAGESRGGRQSKPREPTEVGPSKPQERHDIDPPSKKFSDPPEPTGKAGRSAGGYTSTGHTNTELGDKAEALTQALGLRSILPEGRRSGYDVRESTLDREYDHSGWAFEVKACTVAATEYKAKPKKIEAEGKRRYAEKHKLKPATMILVMDVKKKQAHAYWREGIGAFRLIPGRAEEQGWKFMGTVRW